MKQKQDSLKKIKERNFLQEIKEGIFFASFTFIKTNLL